MDHQNLEGRPPFTPAKHPSLIAPQSKHQRPANPSSYINVDDPTTAKERSLRVSVLRKKGDSKAPRFSFRSYGTSTNASNDEEAGPNPWQRLDKFWGNWGREAGRQGGPSVRTLPLSSLRGGARMWWAGVRQAVSKRPRTLILPLLMFAALVAGTVATVVEVANNTRSRNMATAIRLGHSVGQEVESAVRECYLPTESLRVFVRHDPSFPSLNANFPDAARDLMDLSPRGVISAIQLAPLGIVSAVYPNPTGVAIGHRLFADESRRGDALKAVDVRSLVLAGPYKLWGGAIGAVARYPVFLNDIGPDYPNLVGMDPALLPESSANATLCPKCYDASTGTALWGFTIALISWPNLLESGSLGLGHLAEHGLDYVMTRPGPPNGMPVWSYNNASILANTTNTVDIKDPITIKIHLPNVEWDLLIFKDGGWGTPWRSGIIALVVCLCFMVSALLFQAMVTAQLHSRLVGRMLPQAAIRALHAGDGHFAEPFENVSLLFVDVVSYTTLASQLEPMQVVRLMNEVYGRFDDLTEKYPGLYKVETIGDAYFVSAGVPHRMPPEESAQRLARLALDLIDEARTFVSSEGFRIHIRLGIHSGPVVAAVIGKKMPRYCIYGDTVNTASRMESSSRSMHLHASARTAALLRKSTEFVVDPRGTIEVKGTGPMATFWISHNRQAKALHRIPSGGRPTSLPGAHATTRTLPSTAGVAPTGQALGAAAAAEAPSFAPPVAGSTYVNEKFVLRTEHEPSSDNGRDPWASNGGQVAVAVTTGHGAPGGDEAQEAASRSPALLDVVVHT